MAQCVACSAEVAVYERRCAACGADVRRDVRSHSERWRARLCHLLALPGMLIFLTVPGMLTFVALPGILAFLVSVPVALALALVPLNLIIPLMYRLLNSGSQTVSSHTVDALNFQALWTAIMFLVLSSGWLWEVVGPGAIGLWSLLSTVWLLGVLLVAFQAYDLGNSGDGRYPVRLPLFRLAVMPATGSSRTGEPNRQTTGTRGDSVDRGRDESSIGEWQCSACNATVAANERRCPYCSLGFRPDKEAIPSVRELTYAGWSHLLALPGMIVLIINMTDIVYVVPGFFLIPVNLMIPLVYWLWRFWSPFARRHAAEILNYQLLWTAVVYTLFAFNITHDYPFPLVMWFAFHAVLLGGMAPVLIAANDAANEGDGRYVVRIPVFR